MPVRRGEATVTDGQTAGPSRAVRSSGPLAVGLLFPLSNSPLPSHAASLHLGPAPRQTPAPFPLNALFRFLLQEQTKNKIKPAPKSFQSSSSLYLSFESQGGGQRERERESQSRTREPLLWLVLLTPPPPPAFVWSASLRGSYVRKAPPPRLGWIDRSALGTMAARAADENRRPAAGKPAPGVREMGSRRALTDIKNLVEAAPYPCAVAKKPTLQKSRRDEKKTALPSSRPMTRKFAASLASNQGQPECKPILTEYQPILTDPEPGVDQQKESIGDGTVDIDVELYEPVDDSDSDIDMGETENKEMNQDESLMDIDSADSGNPLAATEYVEELYKFYRENEAKSCVRPDYMSSQQDINSKMRAILIDWLIEVHYKFDLMDETLFLTVNIIDRFLEKEVVPRKKLQLVGVTAMLLACKYEEVSVPVVEDLVLISDRAYTKGQILEMEKLILNTLQFNMSVPTPYVFMKRFLKVADADKQLELVSFFMLELCLVEYQMLNYQPSHLAAAAVYTAQCAINRCPHWTKVCESHSRYTSDQLLECSRMMVDFHQKAGTGKLTGVHRKYSTYKFGCAAKTLPAQFLLESGGTPPPSGAI